MIWLRLGTPVVSSLGNGDHCSEAWRIGSGMADEMGYSEHLMGMPPEQAVFLGHSVGLELDETPVVADRFDRELPIGGAMAIEPKVIYDSGAIGTEDTFARTQDGMECLTMGDSWDLLYRVGGMSRAKKTAQKRLARLLRGRTEPHGIEITDESILKGVEVDDSGIVQLWIQPT